MVVYDLKCGKGHVFEAWFRDSSTFDTQAKAGKVLCPDCGSKKVARAPMAPNVARVQSLSSTEQRQVAADTMKMLRDMREQVEKNADNVGDKFAEEARKIHYGEAKARNIYGQTSKEEAEELVEEGVEFGVIPWVPRSDA
jgi:hypothetical protein